MIILKNYSIWFPFFFNFFFKNKIKYLKELIFLKRRKKIHEYFKKLHMPFLSSGPIELHCHISHSSFMIASCDAYQCTTLTITIYNYNLVKNIYRGYI